VIEIQMIHLSQEVSELENEIDFDQMETHEIYSHEQIPQQNQLQNHIKIIPIFETSSASLRLGPKVDFLLSL
jgi:hypothetical protein